MQAFLLNETQFVIERMTGRETSYPGFLFGRYFLKNEPRGLVALRKTLTAFVAAEEI